VSEHLGPRCLKYDGYKVFVKLTYSTVIFSNAGFVGIPANFTEDRTVAGRDAVLLLEQSIAFRKIVMPPSSGLCSPGTSLLLILPVPGLHLPTVPSRTQRNTTSALISSQFVAVVSLGK
jgi:hypothetical protein